MAHIYVISPSSAVRDKAACKRGLKRLAALGHEVSLDEAALSYHMRFAGDDVTRLAAIRRAAASGADVVLTTRGGYGLTRLLPHLPYDELAASVQRGTRWVGLSDFTALQMALLARTGTPSWAGPSVCDDFGQAVEPDGSPDLIMEACFDDFVCGQGEGTGWRTPVQRVKKAQKSPEKIVATNQYRESVGGKIIDINGVLWGGNLSVISSLAGTPFLPSIEGGILFLEDVGEHPYRIERMLTTLLLAGVLQRQQAVVLGQFSRYNLVRGYDRGFDLPVVADWIAQQAGIPVVQGLPFGHVPTKVLLPVGVEVQLTVEGRDAVLFWGDDD
jgi:muramoyltetrapeptide carboxypeptidase